MDAKSDSYTATMLVGCVDSLADMNDNSEKVGTYLVQPEKLLC